MQVTVNNITTQVEVQAGYELYEIHVEDYSAESAKNSAIAAAVSASNALNSANVASTQAGVAATQAGIATTQAGIATTQASNALSSANAAAASASNALNSANAAAASADSAAQVGTSTLLTGFAAGTNTAIAATDSILAAFNKTQGQINARVSGTGTSGQVSFWNGTTTQTGSNNLFWDNVNNRLGIGTNAPTSNLQISGADATLNVNAFNVAGVARITTNASYLIGPSNEIATLGGVTGNQFGIFRSDLVFGVSGYYGIRFYANGLEQGRVFQTGNWLFQNGGTFTDAGFRLDVNGTARVQGALTVTGSTTASGAVARGANYTPTLVAAANNDILVGLDIAPTFTNGAFTGVSNFGLRLNSNLKLSSNAFLGTGFNTARTTLISTDSTTNAAFFDLYSPLGDGNKGLGFALHAKGLPSTGVTNSEIFEFKYDNVGRAFLLNSIAFSGGTVLPIGIYTGDNTSQLRLFTSGNIGINTTTDAGFRLDVNGTARVQGDATFSTKIAVGASSPTTAIINARQVADSYATNIVDLSASSGGFLRISISGDRPRVQTPNSFDFDSEIRFLSNRRIIAANTVLATSNNILALSVIENNDVTGTRVPHITIGGTASNTFNGGFLGLGYTGTSRVGFTNNIITRQDGQSTTLGLVGTRFNQTIFAPANNSFMAAFLLQPTFNDNTFIGHTKIAFGISNNVGHSIYQSGASSVNYFEGAVSIGVINPNASAQLQVDSTTRGFLPPRMTTAQRDLIATPAAGLIVYNTSTNKHQGYNGTTWNDLY